jgi:hypothetical protein
MSTTVPTAEEFRALAERVAKLERQLARQHRSEWIAARDFPGGPRRARRLRERGRIVGYHLAGCGRGWVRLHQNGADPAEIPGDWLSTGQTDRSIHGR